jgi:hypothetical protein
MAKSLAGITLAMLVAGPCLGMAATAAIPKNLAEAHESLATRFSAADMERQNEVRR